MVLVLMLNYAVVVPLASITLLIMNFQVGSREVDIIIVQKFVNLLLCKKMCALLPAVLVVVVMMTMVGIENMLGFFGEWDNKQRRQKLY